LSVTMPISTNAPMTTMVAVEVELKPN
jgi:hypothetical protein